VFDTNASQTIVTATPTAITFNSERFDHGTPTEQHSTSSDTSRLTCVVPGLYSIYGGVRWDANTTGLRDLWIDLNGTGTIAGAISAIDRRVASTNTMGHVSTEYRLAAGDYVQLFVQQDSGTDRTVAFASTPRTDFGFSWRSP
jgi:hypothetical protein